MQSLLVMNNNSNNNNNNDIEFIPDEIVKEILMRSSDAQRALYRTVCRRWYSLTRGTIDDMCVDWPELACADPHGSSEFMKFIVSAVHVVQNGCVAPCIDFFPTVNAMSHLAMSGRLVDLQWAVDQGWPLRDQVIWGAVYGGHRSIINYMASFGGHIIKKIVLDAAAYGRVDILDWLEQTSTTHVDDDDISVIAAENNRLNVLEWIDARNPVKNTSKLLYDAVVGRGDATLCKWLVDRGATIGDSVATMAVSKRRIDILRWLVSAGYVFDWDNALNSLFFYETGRNAPKRVDIIRWIHEEQGWDVSHLTYACENAACISDDELLMQLYQYGCPLTDNVYKRVAENQNLVLFEWLCGKKQKPHGVDFYAFKGPSCCWCAASLCHRIDCPCPYQTPMVRALMVPDIIYYPEE